MTDLIFQRTPQVVLATNIFINVPIVLQFDDTPLISLVKEQQLGLTTEIPIFDNSGTYLAKVRGTRVYPTDDGKKAGVTVKVLPNHWICSIAGRTAWEIRQGEGDKFVTEAELYTPTAFFVKVADNPVPALIDAKGQELRVGGMTMRGNVFMGGRIGIWVRSNGSVSMGVR